MGEGGGRGLVREEIMQLRSENQHQFPPMGGMTQRQKPRRESFAARCLNSPRGNGPSARREVKEGRQLVAVATAAAG